MEAVQASCSWAHMAPDLLANIFARLSLQHLLVVVPSVCRPWQLASLNPLCYLCLNLRGFSTSPFLDRLLKQVLLPRSQGRLLHIFIPHARSLSSMYILPKSAPLLQTLHAPESYLDDKWAAYAAPLMPCITDLNLNRCSIRMSHLALEAFGKSCRHVLKLRRNRPWGHIGDVNDDEALAIAQYYPFLKHLELQSNPLSEQGLEAILLHCPDLEHLDLAGCSHLWNMDSTLLDRCHAQMKEFCEPRMEADDAPYDDDRICYRDVVDTDDDYDDW